MRDQRSRTSHNFTGTTGTAADAPAPGKQTLTGQIQFKSGSPGPGDARQTDSAATAIEQGRAQKVVETLAPGFGHSFEGVTVHTGAEGEAQTSSRGAPAVAVGKSIYLSNAVDLSSAEGRKVIAHEMAHVIQQTAPPHGPAVATGSPEAAKTDATAFEKEAHEVGDVVATGGQATPTLRTHGETPQCYGAPEHLSMGDNVDSVLRHQSHPLNIEFGGVSDKDIAAQKENEKHADGASHSPDQGPVDQATRGSGRVSVPKLAEMLNRDMGIEMLREGSRNLTISARNYKMKNDAAGPYLALEVDPSTGQAVRYDVPVSPGDLTALNGDLYGSMENMRKAPADEIVAMRNLVEQESRWEADIAAGKRNPKDEPSFDVLYEAATAWRHMPVYAAGVQIGQQGQAAGGDRRSYMDLALNNQAHYGQPSSTKTTLELKVRNNQFAELARGKQGNLADGTEQAWMNGHARARRLARESYDLKHAKKGSAERKKAESDDYGHEIKAPETGVLNPGKVTLPRPKDERIDDAAGHVGSASGLKRSSNVVTPETKLNDAYVENAGADHFLTDAFAAGHQIVRTLIGDAIEQFVRDQGGRQAFLNFIVEKIQDAAIKDPQHAKGRLGDFQDASRSDHKKAIARGVTPLNTYRVVDGLKQELEPRMTHDGLRSLGAKLVHDYYNRHGMIVHNGKGMTFVIKGDGHLQETPEARRIIALAVLESRNQITELAASGTTANPMDVWDYTPDIDASHFTQNSGGWILAKQLSDGDYLWHLLKDDFESLPAPPPASNAQQISAANGTEKEIDQEGREGDFNRCDVVRDDGRCELIDAGQPPVRQWFRRRREYLQKHLAEAEAQSKAFRRQTADGVKIKTPST